MSMLVLECRPSNTLENKRDIKQPSVSPVHWQQDVEQVCNSYVAA